MNTASIHPIEYLKVHLQLEGARLITEITSLVSKVLDQAEPTAKVTA